ncbi:lipoprotein signal peptidase [Filibacter limicola]|uniref:Lipoprotein signal peptidase n=1 Tax=Sporosarcina limicola TaxID=34101 RepID=A0A927MFQ5_9BACL|nr:lipoprotein signal peptidase [Sporosarcina limicola]
MFGGISSVPSWFYILAIAAIILLVIFIEWKTR